MNKAWHKLNKMPANAGIDQRVAWHIAHARHCGCRPMPPRIAAAIADSQDKQRRIGDRARGQTTRTPAAR
jgi:hypothetical protein